MIYWCRLERQQKLFNDIYEKASGKSYKKMNRPVPWTVLRLRAFISQLNLNLNLCHRKVIIKSMLCQKLASVVPFREKVFHESGRSQSVHPVVFGPKIWVSENVVTSIIKKRAGHRPANAEFINL